MITKEQIFFDVEKDMHSPYGARQVKAGVYVSEDPVVLYGPYITLPAGKWTVRVSGRVEGSPSNYVDIVGEGGHVYLGAGVWNGDVCEFDIESQFPINLFEIRIHAGTGAFAQIDHVSVTKVVDGISERKFSLYDRMDLNLLLDKSSMIDREVIKNGSWKPERLEYFKQLAYANADRQRDLVMLDIGAYFGLYSLTMARTNLFSRIVAFEPDTLNHRQLNANLLLNDGQCVVETQCLAISDDRGLARFAPAILHADGNRGGIGISDEGITVETNKIDNLIRHKSRKIFVKIDVAGHELQVIDGMQELLENNSGAIQIETRHNEGPLTARMTRLGYQMVNQIGSDYFYSNLPNIP